MALESSVEVLFLQRGFTWTFVDHLEALPQSINLDNKLIQRLTCGYKFPGKVSATPAPRSKHVHFFVVLFCMKGLFPVYSYLEGVALRRGTSFGWSLLIDSLP